MANDQEPPRVPEPESGAARREEPDLIDRVDEMVPGAWNDVEHPTAGEDKDA